MKETPNDEMKGIEKTQQFVLCRDCRNILK